MEQYWPLKLSRGGSQPKRFSEKAGAEKGDNWLTQEDSEDARDSEKASTIQGRNGKEGTKEKINRKV